MRSWTIAQHFAFWIALFTVVTGLVGLIINPDFAVGDDATAESFIGVDWNGWHGVAALAVGLPGLAIAAYPQYAVPYLVYRAVTDAPVGVWAALDDRPTSRWTSRKRTVPAGSRGRSRQMCAMAS